MAIGQVTRVTGAQVWVSLPTVLPGAEVGPLDAVAGDYAVGDRVLVASLEDDAFVVIGELG